LREFHSPRVAAMEMMARRQVRVSRLDEARPACASVARPQHPHAGRNKISTFAR